MSDAQTSQNVLTKLHDIAEMAAANSEWTFSNISYRINPELLHEAYKQTRKNGAPGIDRVTAEEYAINLEENLANLHEKLVKGQYKAPPVKRVWIDKEDGKKRPIGLPAFEDKIVQRAVTMVLNPIYETDFYPFSYGFRKGFSTHQAVYALRQNCIKLNANWIVDADVSGFFDNLDHSILRELISKRVTDKGICRLIGKWLNAGVLEENILSYPEKGTPQGGVISPLLANIYLHYVLDDWYIKEVRPRMKGRSFLIRYADDFVLGFEYEEDARRFLAVLPKRFNRFGLDINESKTSLINFSRPARDSRISKGESTFDFLGFTFYRGKTLRGGYTIKKRTAKKRLSRFMKSLWIWCRNNRHMPLKEQYMKLCSKLRGHYQYYGVRCNYEALAKVYDYSYQAWRYWLSRRCHKGNIIWEKFTKSIKEHFQLPVPRIIHSI
ncbi:Group II intron-encoded protein [Desulfonema limicola]|uniref:Group II intron-encoded protein n=1 Tax=Desulfonema limicola TaxID=45656 RepID=A0A975GH17_9BACT|nr:group II intron reverse transcriptase/maturase [Desulfonema limicola]QTA80788.1 Group II intron-encoded protein [Desulfonema limicola]